MAIKRSELIDPENAGKYRENRGQSRLQIEIYCTIFSNITWSGSVAYFKLVE
ncbi:MAG: hypothetical protein ACJAS9_002431 [Polaribacter sp.]|jgi:hypothetical protein